LVHAHLRPLAEPDRRIAERAQHGLRLRGNQSGEAWRQFKPYPIQPRLACAAADQALRHQAECHVVGGVHHALHAPGRGRIDREHHPIHRAGEEIDEGRVVETRVAVSCFGHAGVEAATSVRERAGQRIADGHQDARSQFR
jgi:hypothetical protein